MMLPNERYDLIYKRLSEAFSPRFLEVIDDSEKHKGHAGSALGAGHYTVVISSDRLANLSRVAAHKKIYEVLNDLIPHEIHALQINFRNELLS